MEVGQEVTFWITGNLAKYKGTVTTLYGHHGAPEIKVTHVRDITNAKKSEWVPCTDWPTLKDGDYILLREDLEQAS